MSDATVPLRDYVDVRFDDTNKRIDQLDAEVTKRFNGMDKNFERLFKVVNERGGGIALVRTIVPSLIAIGSLVLAIVEVAHH